ncbi:MAG: DEAD/DEAH box helicase, partial [Deltaproteobacteria bacterium]|nr:DEAD/DEAH box helicase [Deltaproteobacteria bacterium]
MDEPPPHSDDEYFGYDPALDNLDAMDHGYERSTKSLAGGQKHTDITLPDKKPKPGSLKKILEEVFHFDSFRPYQQRVCESVTRGNDLLLVMPTGSGKSLCYQLPGIARNG